MIVRRQLLADGFGPPTELTAAVTDADGSAWSWIDVQDPTVVDLSEIQSLLGLHPLAVEDARHRGQRPKVELFDDHSFIVLRPVGFAASGELVESELHLFILDGTLVTLRFTPAVDLGVVVRRWESSNGSKDVASAVYVVMDEVVDGYLGAVDRLEDMADDLEDQVFGRGRLGDDPTLVQSQILRLRREVVRLRRLASPTRAAIDLLIDDGRYGTPELAPYLRDVAEHLLRVTEFTDNVRDTLTTILEVRTAQAANELNEVMKKLTAWAAIVLVPTLVAGIYGMNFEGIPELHWGFGYPLALGMMVAVAGILYAVFKKRGWL